MKRFHVKLYFYPQCLQHFKAKSLSDLPTIRSLTCGKIFRMTSKKLLNCLDLITYIGFSTFSPQRKEPKEMHLQSTYIFEKIRNRKKRGIL